MKKNRKHYQTPNLKVVSFEVESGFAGSSTGAPVTSPAIINFRHNNESTSASSTWSTSTTNTDGWFN